MSDVGVLGVERQKGTFTRGPRHSTGTFRRNPPVHGLGSGHDQRPDLDLVQLGRDQRGLRDVEKCGVLWNVLERTFLEVKVMVSCLDESGLLRNTRFSPLPLSCNNTADKTLGPLTSCLVLSSLPPSCCLSPSPLPAQVGQDELDEKRSDFRGIAEAFLFGCWFGTFTCTARLSCSRSSAAVVVAVWNSH